MYFWILPTGQVSNNLNLLEVFFCVNPLAYLKYTGSFLIVNNPDFEYVACLHIPEYKGQEVTKFLQTVLGFQSLEQFKKNIEVYECLNNGQYSYQILIQRIRGKDKFVKNAYSVKKKNFEIAISRTDVTWELVDRKGSNMEEFFDVIDW